MENTTKVNENIYRLTIPFKGIFTTVYLIITSEGATLFDVAANADDVENYIIPFLKEIGITSDMLKYVFISHKHGDHSGGLKRFMQEFPMVCIISQSPELKTLYENYNFILPEDNYIVSDVLQIISIPGHTKDSCAILDTRTNTLITGDSLQLYGVFGSKDWACNITLPVEHMEAINKLRNLCINEVYMAHDYHPFGYKVCGKEEINRALDLCIEPLLYIRDLILQNQDKSDEEIRSIYNNSDDIPTVSTRVIASLRTALDEDIFK